METGNFLTNYDSENLHQPWFGPYKMICDEKSSYFLSQESGTSFSFLKGKNGDTMETGHFMTNYDSETIHKALSGPYKMICQEKSSYFLSHESGMSLLKERMETPLRRGTSWPTTTLKLYIMLYLDHTKWFVKKKVHISSQRSQERPFSFLKGKNGDTVETGYFLTNYQSETLHKALFGLYKMICEEKKFKFPLTGVRSVPLASLKQIIKTPRQQGTSWPSRTLKIDTQLSSTHRKWFLEVDK